MIIYEVNLTIDADIATEYSTWLREHVRDLLTLDGFEGATWYTRTEAGDAVPDDEAPEGPRYWTLHYFVRDADALNTYLEEHAERFRKDGLDRYEGRFSVDRRILKRARTFSAPSNG
ncbi:MAG: DUF4286 family protein [Longimonas sp.]|uniref:DUF4286 family protein n=1 Tax=Longimonas sp. TaxID=2039626 RepID=UPI00336174B0